MARKRRRSRSGIAVGSSFGGFAILAAGILLGGLSLPKLLSAMAATTGEQVVDRLKEKNKKSENTQGMISDSLLSAANGIISVINVNDKAPNQFFKVAEATLTSLVAADWAEGQTEKWLRLAALVCNIGAFYDPAIGLTSLFTTDEGAIVPSTSTTPTTADDSTGDSFLDGWLANNGLAA